jgi:hypothetical protein
LETAQQTLSFRSGQNPNLRGTLRIRTDISHKILQSSDPVPIGAKKIHRVLRLKAAETDRSISDFVNDAVKLSLAEDVEDPAAFKERTHEPNLAFEDVLNDLRKRGKL